MLGFFSFTEVTDPAGHGAYNRWHQFDHLPEQFSLSGITFGQRWVASPVCRAARVAVSPLLQPCHYMTLYLMHGPEVLMDFFALASRLREEDRFFADRVAHLSGPFDVRDRWAATRVKVSAPAIAHRPANGIYVLVGPPIDGPWLVGQEGVAGVWAFVDQVSLRHITVAFVDGDLMTVAGALGPQVLELGLPMEWAGPLEEIDPKRHDWFDRLTPR